MFIIVSEFVPLIINTELYVTSDDQFPSSLLPPALLLYVSVCVHVFVLSGYFLFYFDGETGR